MQKSSLVLAHTGNTETASLSVINQSDVQSLQFHDALILATDCSKVSTTQHEKTEAKGLTTEGTFFTLAEKRLKRGR
jgi:hypothetical protein